MNRLIPILIALLAFLIISRECTVNSAAPRSTAVGAAPVPSSPATAPIVAPRPAETTAKNVIELAIGSIEIVYEGVFEGRCEGTLDHVGELTGECRIERIMGSAPQDASFAEPMALAGTVRSDAAGAYFEGFIHDDISFDGRGNSTGAAGSWRFASPSGWQVGGKWRAVVRRN